MIHIDLLAFMGTVSRNMFSNPQPASAPTIPFSPLNIGGFVYQPDGSWQRSQWNGQGWVPQSGEYAVGDIKSQLDGIRSELLNSDAQRQAELERAFRNAFPISSSLFTNGGAIAEICNRDYGLARGWVAPRDPLVLDLDGDGIEATAIDPNNLVLFDHNGDGIRQATGWISADDGIVVLDRNGNGTIDSGRELFGDNTLNEATPNPGDVHANGYAALAELDLNNDGKIDASDAAYTQLRIWKDTNQNGISEAGELKTLAELNIASIGVVGTASNINLGNGNTMPLAASFTRTNGSTGTSGTPDVSGSLLLASNNFYREFTDDPEITQEAAALPQMGGSGLVRDLREAMSLQTDEAEALQATVAAFAAATTRQAQLRRFQRQPNERLNSTFSGV